MGEQMSDWRERQNLSQRLFENTRETLQKVMQRGCEDWPLPEPPLSDPDFPVRPPESPEHLQQVAIALLEANRAAFDRDLEEIGEALIPHRLSLSADPEREGRKWLGRREDEVAERALFSRLETMLAQALDREAPDVDRWWAAIALLNGLSSQDSLIARQQGYHLLESICIAKPPGGWHGGASPGPHLIDWSPDMQSIDVLDVHERGVFAAGWLLDRMEEADPPRPLLVEWLEMAMVRGALVEPLAILNRLCRMASDGNISLTSRIASLLPHAWDKDPIESLRLQKILLGREPSVRCAVADTAEMMLQRRGKDALPLLDELLASNENQVIRIATGSLALVAKFDQNAFLERASRLAHHEDSGVKRRFSQTCLRELLEIDVGDSQGLTVHLWNDGDEVVRSRLRELLLRMDEVEPSALSSILQRICAEAGEQSLDDLWMVMEVRSTERCEAWKLHLFSDGPLP